MPHVTIFSGTHCQAEEVAQKLAQKLSLTRIEKRLIESASEKYSISGVKLERAMHGPVPVLNKITREREKCVAYLRAALAELIQGDNLLLHGFAGLLLPRSIAHVLRVCIIANRDYRMELAAKALNKSTRDAAKIIQKEDSQRQQWTEFLFDKGAWDDSLFDIIIPMQDTSIDKAVEMIDEILQKDILQPTTESQQAVRNNILATKVNLSLVEKGHDVDVSGEGGNITVIIKKYVMRLEQHERELESIAGTIEGVKSVQSKVGPKYNPPMIYPGGDFEMPSRILLVDDEKEFVHTLSERLETRNLPASVVYNGEEALSHVRNEEPEVMVLDLKMPGIDGLEVLRQVKSTNPNVEVIILTGHGSEKEKEQAAELGAFAYLHKPVDIDLLTRTMHEAYKKVNQSKIQGDPEDEEL